MSIKRPGRWWLKLGMKTENQKSQHIVLHCPWRVCEFTAPTMTEIVQHVCLRHTPPPVTVNELDRDMGDFKRPERKEHKEGN